MGNQSRRRAEAERRKRRGRLIGVASTVLVLGLAAVGWRVLSRDDRPGEGEGWHLTDVTLDLVRPDDPDASDFEGHGYRVLFDAEWEGDAEEPPGRALVCTLEMMDSGGEIVHETEFGLFVGTGSTSTWNPTAIGDDEFDGVPVEASISCVEDSEGRYLISNVEVVRGWKVDYVADWLGDDEPRVEACEVWLVREDDRDSPVEEVEVALAPRMAGERQTIRTGVDELTLPPEDARVTCDPEDLDTIIE